jgi:hypothetical protein
MDFIDKLYELKNKFNSNPELNLIGELLLYKLKKNKLKKNLNQTDLLSTNISTTIKLYDVFNKYIHTINNYFNNINIDVTKIYSEYESDGLKLINEIITESKTQNYLLTINDLDIITNFMIKILSKFEK